MNRASTRRASSPSSPGIRMSRKTASTAASSRALRTSAPETAVRTVPTPGPGRAGRRARRSAGASSSATSTRSPVTAGLPARCSAVTGGRRGGTSAPACSPWYPRRGRSPRPGRTRLRRPDRSRSSTLPSPTLSPSGSPASVRRTASGSMPTPSSSTEMTASLPWSRATIVTWPGPALPSRPCRTAFSTSGCTQRNGTVTGSTSGATCSGDLQPVAEPGPLQQQVAVDRAQLLGQGGEVAVPAERVAGEVGELQQQLAGPLRVGAHEGRDRGQ